MGAPTVTSPVRVAVSFTGGKDSTLVVTMLQLMSKGTALPQHLAERMKPFQNGEPVLLVTFAPGGRSASFRAHPLPLVSAQAAALGLPHVVVDIQGPDYQESYRQALTQLRLEHAVQALATGDILDVCNNFMGRATAAAHLPLWTPLWGLPRPLLLQSLWGLGLHPVISCINLGKFRQANQPALPAVAVAVAGSGASPQELQGLGAIQPLTAPAGASLTSVTAAAAIRVPASATETDPSSSAVLPALGAVAEAAEAGGEGQGGAASGGHMQAGLLIHGPGHTGSHKAPLADVQLQCSTQAEHTAASGSATEPELTCVALPDGVTAPDSISHPVPTPAGAGGAAAVRDGHAPATMGLCPPVASPSGMPAMAVPPPLRPAPAAHTSTADTLPHTRSGITPGAGIAQQPALCRDGEGHEPGVALLLEDPMSQLLGAALTPDFHRQVLQPAAQQLGLDECGEWGEFHTMVLSGPTFQRPLAWWHHPEVDAAGEFAYLVTDGIS